MVLPKAVDPCSGDVCPFWELFSYVTRTKTSVLSPVGVPIRSVWTAGAPVFPAAHGFEAIRDLGVLRGAVLLETGPVAVKEQAPHEDHEAPEVVLVQASDGADQLSFDRHDDPSRTLLGMPS